MSLNPPTPVQTRLFGLGCTLKSAPFTDRRTVPEWQRMIALRPARNAAMDAMLAFEGPYCRVYGITMDKPTPHFTDAEIAKRSIQFGYDAAAHEKAKAEFKKLDAEYQAAHDAWGLVYVDLY